MAPSINDASSSSRASTPNMNTLAAAPSPNWTPVATDAHNQRAHPYVQTGSLIRHETATLSMNSSRGFDRGMPPTNATRPALRSRRNSVDVVYAVQIPRPQGHGEVEKERFAYPAQSTLGLEQVPIHAHKTDEPPQRRPLLGLPEPLRYRELHRGSQVRPEIDNKLYLDVGKTSITNEDFHSMVDMSWPECWFRDSVLDVALELLCIRYNGDANRIGVATSMSAQCIRLGADPFADMTQLSEYKAMLEDKRWIFMPLNNGYGETSMAEEQGTHWALLAIDRPNGKAHFVDSLYNHHKEWQEDGRTMAYAIGKLLGEEYKFVVEYNAPHQNRHNSTWKEDHGPCGPFVVKMVDQYMKLISTLLHYGHEHRIHFHLPDSYGQPFYYIFNSEIVRWNLMFTLAGFKKSQVTDRMAAEHDMRALEGLQGVVWMPKPADPFFSAPLFDLKSQVVPTIGLSKADRELEFHLLQWGDEALLHQIHMGPSTAGNATPVREPTPTVPDKKAEDTIMVGEEVSDTDTESEPEAIDIVMTPPPPDRGDSN